MNQTYLTTTQKLFRAYSRFVSDLSRQDSTAFGRLLVPAFGVGVITTDAASDSAAASMQLAVKQTQGTQPAP